MLGQSTAPTTRHSLGGCDSTWRSAGPVRVEQARASGVAEVAQAEVAYVAPPDGEQWWPAEP
jgi:hypothetical protein